VSAPRAPEDSVRPRRLIGASGRPLNFTVRRLGKRSTVLNAYYPLFIALIGLFASALLSERALSLMQADAKAALIDSSRSTRLLNLLVMTTFAVLILWRPLVAWGFLGCSFLALGVRSLFRLRRLELPVIPSRLILAGNTLAVGGIVACAVIYALRTLR
jgi:hypothetical protein